MIRFGHRYSDKFSVPLDVSQKYARFVIRDYIDDNLRKEGKRSIVVSEQDSKPIFDAWNQK